MNLHIQYVLRYKVRRDDEAKVWVTYVPALQLFGQTQDKGKIEKMVNTGITTFLRLCHERGILDDVMRQRGLIPSAQDVSAEKAKEILKKSGAEEYIIVGNLAQESYQVPISLLAAQQELAACQH